MEIKLLKKNNRPLHISNQYYKEKNKVQITTDYYPKKTVIK